MVSLQAMHPNTRCETIASAGIGPVKYVLMSKERNIFGVRTVSAESEATECICLSFKKEIR